MILIGIPPFLSPLVSLLLVLFGALTMTRTRRSNLTPYDDSEDRIADFTRKVRYPQTHRIRRWIEREP